MYYIGQEYFHLLKRIEEPYGEKSMSKVTLLAICATVLLGLSACSSTSSKYANVSDNDKYVYVVDYEKVAAVERAARRSTGSVKTYWLRYPMKKIKKSEYLKAKNNKQ